MVTPVRTYGWDLNYSIVGANANAQFQDSILRLKQGLIGQNTTDINSVATALGAWTVVGSSNGTVANTSDNWATSADIVSASGAVAHSWIVIQSPDMGMLGGRIWLIIDCNDGAGTVQDFELIMCSDQPDLTTPVTTARPTATNEVAMGEQVWQLSAFAAKSFHFWRTTIGEFIAVMSTDGTLIPESGIVFWRCDNGEAGVQYPFFCYREHLTSGLGAFTASNLATSGNIDGFWQDKTPLTAVMNMNGPGGPGGNTTSNWTNGRSNINNGVPDFPLAMTWNSATEAAIPGYIPDIRLSASSVPNNETNNADTDAIVRTTVGQLLLPVPRTISVTL